MDRNYTLHKLPEGAAQVAAALADPAFAEVETQPQIGRYGRAYYAAVHGAAMTNHTFVIEWDNKPILLVMCSLLDGVLGLHGLPMRIFARPGLERDVERGAVKVAFAHLDELSKLLPIKEYWLRERARSELDAVGTAALGREAVASVALIGVVDLTAGPEVWKRALRKRFRQFINWGGRSLTLTYVKAGPELAAQFDRYREFHARVAGRVTRPRASWDVMEQHVAEGRGELLLAEYEGKLAAGSLFIDGTDISLYMNGVYDRDLDKPLAHTMIWQGIERAKLRGMKTLHLGDVHQVGGSDEKRYNIGYFKRGFATDIQAWIDWRWELGRSE